MKIQPEHTPRPDSNPSNRSWLLLVMEEPEPDSGRSEQTNALAKPDFGAADPPVRGRSSFRLR